MDRQEKELQKRSELLQMKEFEPMACVPVSGYDQILNPYEYEFLKSFLYAVHTGWIEDDKIEVIRCVAFNSHSLRPLVPSVTDSGTHSIPVVGDGTIEITLNFKEELYDISVTMELMPNGVKFFKVYCMGLSGDANEPKSVTVYCLQQAMRNSFYRNQILRVKPSGNFDEALNIEPVEMNGRPLNQIFLAKQCADAIELFIETIKNYGTLQRSLHLLFSGRPGTGKTESIRSIVEACKGVGTFLIVQGQCKMREVFQFASCFSPAILCLDDIDLICPERLDQNDTKRLSEFLSTIDGFTSPDLFILATTNDKRWVDVAASRPGRFDMILDFDVLDQSVYQVLIRERCKDNDLVGLFTEDVIGYLVRKKVTGAFVANMLKYLEINKALSNGSFDRCNIMDLIEGLHRGFYRRSNNGSDRVGF